MNRHDSSFRRARRLSVLVLSALLATATLVACAGDAGRSATDSALAEPTVTGQRPEGGASSDVQPTDPAIPAATVTPATTAAAATTASVTGGHDRDDIATLLAARPSAPSAEGVEQVVFEFDGDSVPRYEISYLAPPFIQCGSGNPIAVTGGAVLQLRLRGTRAHAEYGDEIRPTVTERDRKPGQPLLRQLILTCDFEGEVEWLLGLTSRIPFRVLELTSRARLVVELSPAR